MMRVHFSPAGASLSTTHAFTVLSRDSERPCVCIVIGFPEADFSSTALSGLLVQLRPPLSHSFRYTSTQVATRGVRFNNPLAIPSEDWTHRLPEPCATLPTSTHFLAGGYGAASAGTEETAAATANAITSPTRFLTQTSPSFNETPTRRIHRVCKVFGVTGLVCKVRFGCW